MIFNGKHYPSITKKQLLMLKNNNITEKKDSYFHKAIGVMFTQISAKEGIKQFGERAIATMVKELKQLNNGAMKGKPVVVPIDPSKLTKSEKRYTLDAVNLIKEKINGDIKGKICANGAKQRRYVKAREITYSLTVSLVSILTTLTIDAYEGRDITIVDVPGGYFHTDMTQAKGKIVLLKLKGNFVDIMCSVNKEFTSHVICEGKTKVLYMKVLRAIYGFLESTMLWYNIYVTTLKGMGFELIPYDLCVANKIINGKQCTIIWFVDDNKIIQMDPAVVDSIIKELTKYFGELSITKGKEHAFLGMNIKIRDDENIEIDMIEQLKEVIAWLGEN